MKDTRSKTISYPIHTHSTSSTAHYDKPTKLFPSTMKLVSSLLPILSLVAALPSVEIQAIKAIQAADSSPAPVKNCQPGLKYCFNQIISDLGTLSPKAPPPLTCLGYNKTFVSGFSSAQFFLHLGLPPLGRLGVANMEQGLTCRPCCTNTATRNTSLTRCLATRA